MSAKTEEIRELISAKVLTMYKLVGELKPDLSAKESDYDLSYISAKLALMLSFLEKMGDISYELIQIHLQVEERLQACRVIVENTEKEIKASNLYSEQRRDVKAHYVRSQMKEELEELENWKRVARQVSDIRGAVLNKIELTKRLDSTIRLQKSVVESKLSSGATSSVSFKGTSVGELDLE